jgi:hypothetical protein
MGVAAPHRSHTASFCTRERIDIWAVSCARTTDIPTVTIKHKNAILFILFAFKLKLSTHSMLYCKRKDIHYLITKIIFVIKILKNKYEIKKIVYLQKKIEN